MFQRNFAAGEISPTLYGGADPGRYLSALATCRNFIVMRGGGVANRTGTEFIAEVKNSNVRTYLLKFVFNNQQTYIIEAGDHYFRFYSDGARVVVSSVDPWSSLTAYVIGDLVQDGSVNYYCTTPNTNQEPPNGDWLTLTDDIYEIPTPYAAADLARLKIVQSGDVITITHPDYPIYELTRYGDTRWIISGVSTAPSIAAPTGLDGTHGTAGSLNYVYSVTAVKADTYEESVESATKSISCVAPSATAPNTLTWDAVDGAVEYNVYLDNAGNGKRAFIGVASGATFNDIGYTPNGSVTPPLARTLFNTTDSYPQCAGYFQQRLVVGGSNAEPFRFDASKTGTYHNFSISSPIQDDDAITVRMASRLVTEVRALIELNVLVVLTSTGEWVAFGDSDGTLKPTAINLRQQGYNGISDLPPVLVGNLIIFNQARGGILRDLRLDATTGTYAGQDLSVFADHLFTGYSIDRMDYAQIPHSIVWCLRSDGTLLGLTYLPEFNVWGWHRHDTGDGDFFEDVCTVPESTPSSPGASPAGVEEEDAVYVIASRLRNVGPPFRVRCIERFASRAFTDYRLDAIFLDSSLTYNGIDTSGVHLQLSTATTWLAGQTITVDTTGDPAFDSSDVGKGITVWIPGVAVARINVTTYVSATRVRGPAAVDVPVELQSGFLANWSRAVATVSGLNHIIGRTVSVLANGVVLSAEVSAFGSITLDDVYDVIHVGLPITADVETLDLDSAQDDVRDREKLLGDVSLLVEHSRGINAGPDADHLLTFVPSTGTTLGLDIFDPAGANTLNELVEMGIHATWDKPSRVFVRQTDPLPLSILAVVRNPKAGG